MPPGKSVLLVDDSRSHCFFVERAFAQVNASASIVTVGSGEDALSLLQLCPRERPTPDLVLLDCEMPGGMNGFQTLLAIRALPGLPTLPVLILSGSDDEAHVEQARASGADGYALKPPDQAMYVELVRQIDRWTPTHSWRFAAGPRELLRLPGDAASETKCPAPLPFRPKRQAPLSENEQMRALEDAAAQAQVPLALALNTRFDDHRVVLRRQKFVRLLMAWDWRDAEIQKFLPVDQSYLLYRRMELRRTKAFLRV